MNKVDVKKKMKFCNFKTGFKVTKQKKMQLTTANSSLSSCPSLSMSLKSHTCRWNKVNQFHLIKPDSTSHHLHNYRYRTEYFAPYIAQPKGLYLRQKAVSFVPFQGHREEGWSWWEQVSLCLPTADHWAETNFQICHRIYSSPLAIKERHAMQ